MEDALAAAIDETRRKPMMKKWVLYITDGTLIGEWIFIPVVMQRG